MATSVAKAFLDFYSVVNVSQSQSTSAIASRDWLKGRIAYLGETVADFPPLHAPNNIDFGSFARKTKIIEVDDIDIMVGMAGGGAYYQDGGATNQHEIVVTDSPRLNGCCDTVQSLLADPKRVLNSRKVLNKFKSELTQIPQYRNAEMKATQQAVTLKLSSYPWNFDVVPCFHTALDAVTNRTYYLIPDGKGHWMKTDPRIDRDRVTRTNQAHGGAVLQVIRLIKYWNKRPTMPSGSSYLIENMVLDYFDSISPKGWPPYLYLDEVFDFISGKIFLTVQDPKGIQGDLNSLSGEDKLKIYMKALGDRDKAKLAFAKNYDGDVAGAINLWKQIFGPAFPDYG